METIKEELKKKLNEINDDDLKVMFDTAFVQTIINKDTDIITGKLEEYYKYDIPVSLGDMIEFQNGEYVVTCLYTDNSVDLLSKFGHKKNVGLYQKENEIKMIGKLEVIQEEI